MYRQGNRSNAERDESREHRIMGVVTKLSVYCGLNSHRDTGQQGQEIKIVIRTPKMIIFFRYTASFLLIGFIKTFNKGTMLTEVFYQAPHLKNHPASVVKRSLLRISCRDCSLTFPRLISTIFIQTTRHHRTIGMNADMINSSMATPLRTLMRQ
jgi:hypothetical protein